MTFSSLLINLHLLLSIYALFIFWKDDALSRGSTIETITNYYRKTRTQKSVILAMLLLCVFPILNLITLYRLTVAEIETNIGNLLRRHQQRVPSYTSTDSRLEAIYQHRSVLLAQLNYARNEEETVELMQQIKACNQKLAEGKNQIEYSSLEPTITEYPKHLSRLDESIRNVCLSIHSQNGSCYSFFICIDYRPVFVSGYVYNSWKHAQNEGRKKMKEFAPSVTS